MNREKIIKLAREHDLNCYGSLTENSLYTEILVDFVAAIRAATKEEDAGMCDLESSKLGQTKEALVAGICAATIRASK